MSLWYRDTGLCERWAVSFLIGLGASCLMGTVVSAQTIIVPTISVSGTYDSNVYYTPKSLLPPDLQADDYYTTVTPQINMAHTGRLFRANLLGGALITKYIHNKDLDYIGYNAGGRLDFTDLATKVSQRFTGFSVNGTYQYTPSLSAFGATGGAALGSGYGTTGGIGPLDAGLVTNRVTLKNYTAGISGGYLLTRTTTLTSNYNYTSVSFGSQSGGFNSLVFDTTGHQGSTTITTQLNQRDSVGTTATMSHYQQGGGDAGGAFSFTTISGVANWNRMWTQRLSTSLSGGAILTLPIESSIPGQSTKAQGLPTARASLSYSSFSEGLRTAGASTAKGPFDGMPRLAGSLSPGIIAAPGEYTISSNYAFTVFPSYTIGAGPMKAHVLTVNASGGITQNLSVQAGINVARGSGDNFSYDTVLATTGLTYLVGPVLASLSYSYMFFSNSADVSPTSQQDLAFSKKMVTLTLTAAFNSQAFFRTRGFGMTGTSGAGDKTTVPGGAGQSAPSGTGAPGSLKKE